MTTYWKYSLQSFLQHSAVTLHMWQFSFLIVGHHKFMKSYLIIKKKQTTDNNILLLIENVSCRGLRHLTTFIKWLSRSLQDWLIYLHFQLLNNNLYKKKVMHFSFSYAFSLDVSIQRHFIIILFWAWKMSVHCALGLEVLCDCGQWSRRIVLIQRGGQTNSIVCVLWSSQPDRLSTLLLWTWWSWTRNQTEQ